VSSYCGGILTCRSWRFYFWGQRGIRQQAFTSTHSCGGMALSSSTWSKLDCGARSHSVVRPAACFKAASKGTGRPWSCKPSVPEQCRSPQGAVGLQAGTRLQGGVRLQGTGGTCHAVSEAQRRRADPLSLQEAVEQRFYVWGPGKRISYRVMKGTSRDESPLVLLTGFGVGSFHYDNLLAELQGCARDVFLMDFFGQGDSWPTVDPCPSPDASIDAGFEHGFGAGPVAPEFEGFRFSADMWTEQLTYFMEQIVGRPAILCGNSLGGFISVNLASQRPDLVVGLVLLNATPFWGTTALRFWDGRYPLPKALR